MNADEGVALIYCNGHVPPHFKLRFKLAGSRYMFKRAANKRKIEFEDMNSRWKRFRPDTICSGSVRRNVNCGDL